MLKESSIIEFSYNMFNTFQHYKERWNKIEAALAAYEVAYGKDIEATIKELTSSKERIRENCAKKLDACFDLIELYDSNPNEKNHEVAKEITKLEDECKIVKELMQI